MAQLPSLPVLSFQVSLDAVSPWVPGTWTELETWVLDFQTKMGKEHAVDRVESGTLNAKLDGRDGAVGALGITSRLPVRVRVTTGAGTFPVFQGAVQSFEELPPSQPESEWTFAADDLLRMLSLSQLRNAGFYALHFGQTFAADTPDVDCRFWDFGATQVLSLCDVLQGKPLTQIGNVKYGAQAGVTLYDDTQCADLTNGTGGSANAGHGGAFYVTGIPTTDGNDWAVDFWVIGQGLNSVSIKLLSDDFAAVGPFYNRVPLVLTNNGTGYFQLVCNPSGYPCLMDGANELVRFQHHIPISDGQWHHVGLLVDSTAQAIHLIVDGSDGGAIDYSALDYPGGCDGPGGKGVPIGALGIYEPLGPGTPLDWRPAFPGYIDNLVATAPTGGGHFTNGAAGVIAEIKSRYQAGIMLQLQCFSGDRIAEALVLAGAVGVYYAVDGADYGTIPFNAPGLFTLRAAATVHGTVLVQPMVNSVVDSYALDLIGYIEDTESGIFAGSQDGSFDFYSQQYWSCGTRGKTVQVTFSDNNAGGSVPYMPDHSSLPIDDQDLWTRTIVEPTNGVKQVRDNVANQEPYGTTTLRKTGTMHVRNEDAGYLADTLLGWYSGPPLQRVASLELDNAIGNGSSLAAALKLQVWDRVSVLRNIIAPPGTTTTLLTLVGLLEIIEHDFQANPGSWKCVISSDPYRLIGEIIGGGTPFVFDTDSKVDLSYLR